MPDDCSLDDVLYHLYVIQAVESGLEDVAHGRIIPHDAVADKLRRKWQADRAYDCIILDLKMPGMSGQHLYQAIEAHDRELAGRVIFITGDTVRSDTLDFIAAAGNPALSKPIDPDELTRRVWGSS